MFDLSTTRPGVSTFGTLVHVGPMSRATASRYPLTSSDDVLLDGEAEPRSRNAVLHRDESRGLGHAFPH